MTTSGGIEPPHQRTVTTVLGLRYVLERQGSLTTVASNLKRAVVIFVPEIKSEDRLRSPTQELRKHYPEGEGGGTGGEGAKGAQQTCYTCPRRNILLLYVAVRSSTTPSRHYTGGGGALSLTGTNDRQRPNRANESESKAKELSGKDPGTDPGTGPGTDPGTIPESRRPCST